MPICRVNDFEIADILCPSKYISSHLISHFPFLPINVKENCKKKFLKSYFFFVLYIFIKLFFKLIFLKISYFLNVPKILEDNVISVLISLCQPWWMLLKLMDFLSEMWQAPTPLSDIVREGQRFFCLLWEGGLRWETDQTQIPQKAKTSKMVELRLECAEPSCRSKSMLAVKTWAEIRRKRARWLSSELILLWRQCNMRLHLKIGSPYTNDAWALMLQSELIWPKVSNY